MDNNTKQQLLNELENLTMNMNIPFLNLRDPDWLLENVEVSNVGHKNINKIIQISKLLVKDKKFNG